jgi:hypothetical protein
MRVSVQRNLPQRHRDTEGNFGRAEKTEEEERKQNEVKKQLQKVRNA